MSIGRRSFLKSATMSALSAGIALGGAHLIFGQQARNRQSRQALGTGELDASGNFAIPMEAQQDALSYFRSSTFSPYVGDIFQAPNALGQMVELRLSRVSDYRMKAGTKIATRKSLQPRSFSLTFSGTQPLPPFTSIHKISHPALGEFDLFLTSSETENGTFIYEAVFNHIR